MHDRFKKALDLILCAERGVPLRPFDMRASGLGGDSGAIAWLVLLLAVALVLRTMVAISFPSVYFPDEMFQYWEQGYRLVFGYGIVPWEYRAGIRSWLVPGAIGGVIASSTGSAAGRTYGAPPCRRCCRSPRSASSPPASSGRGGCRDRRGDPAAFVATFWFEFVYFSARPLTEIWPPRRCFRPPICCACVPEPSRRVRLARRGAARVEPGACGCTWCRRCFRGRSPPCFI